MPVRDLPGRQGEPAPGKTALTIPEAVCYDGGKGMKFSPGATRNRFCKLMTSVMAASQDSSAFFAGRHNK